MERVTRSQAFGYIKKPATSGTLRGTLELALAQYRHAQELRQQLHWLKGSFSAVPDAVVAVDGWGRIAYLNTRAEELIGCADREILGRPYREVVRFCYELKGWPPGDLPEVEDLVPAAMLGGIPIQLPAHANLAAAGRLTAIEGSVSPRWEEERLAGAIIFFRDIGSRQIAERRQIEETKQQALWRLISEIQSGLNSQAGAAAEQAEQLLRRLPRKGLVRHNVENLEKAALSTFSMISRFSSCSRPYCQIQQLQVNEVLSSLEPIWKSKFPGLCFRLGRLPAPVSADRYQLIRVFSLITEHAAESLKPGTSLLVETSHSELEGTGAWIQIRFSYPGFGEDGEALQRAFEPSFSAPREGLPTAYRLIREMRGFLTADFEPGAIVSWTVYLPPSAIFPEIGASRPAILLLERNSYVCSVLQQYFDRHGIDLLCVCSSEEARAAVDFYGCPFLAAIANLPHADKDREQFAQLLPGVPILWLDGYRNESAEVPFRAPTQQLLTQSDLLEWTRQACTAIPSRSVAANV
jgi:PAS domain S-box-containing protein